MTANKKLNEEFRRTVLSSSAIDILTDFSEARLDSVLDSEILKEIPVVKTIVGLARAGISISDRILIGKIVKFLTNIQEIPENDRQEAIEKLEADDRYRRKVGEHLLEILDRVDSHHKPEMLAKAFKAYAEGKIDSRILQQLYSVVERIPIFMVTEVRKYVEGIDPKKRELNSQVGQDLMLAGLTRSVSVYDGTLYDPNGICQKFLSLELDIPIKQRPDSARGDR